MRALKKELWPCKVTIDSDNKHDITPIEVWLGEQLGKFRGRWNIIYRYKHTDFYFKHEKDAVFFALRWT